MGNLIVEETFEGSTYFPNSGTTLNKIRSYENCNPSSKNPNGDVEHGTQYDWTLQRVNSAYAGTKGVQFEVRRDQPLVGNSQLIRSEVVIISGKEDSRWTNDAWYSYGMYFPSRGQETDSGCAEVVTQWWEDGGNDQVVRIMNGKAFFEGTKPSGMALPLYDLFKVTNSLIDVVIGYGTTSNSNMVPIPKDKWTYFVYHIIHSFGTDGLVEIWRDGVKIYRISGCNMHAGIPKFKIGMYKPSMLTKSKLSSRIIYFDNVRVGKAGATVQEMMNGTPPPVVNQVPICRAGDDMEIQLPTNSVQVIGTASDIDGFIANILWSQASGPAAKITSPASLNTTITNLQEGVSIFKLLVTDDKGAVSEDELVITTLAADVIPPTGRPITGFKLIDAAKETEVRDIVDGDSISVKIYGGSRAKLNVKAEADSSVDQVRFQCTGPDGKISTDRSAPFSLHGDTMRNGSVNYYYGNWNPPSLGTYKIVATPFDSSGQALATSTINFTFVA